LVAWPVHASDAGRRESPPYLGFNVPATSPIFFTQTTKPLLRAHILTWYPSGGRPGAYPWVLHRRPADVESTCTFMTSIAASLPQPHNLSERRITIAIAWLVMSCIHCRVGEKSEKDFEDHRNASVRLQGTVHVRHFPENHS